MEMQLLGSKVMIRVDPTERQTGSGLWLQESVWDYAYQGTVVTVGPGLIYDGVQVPLDVNVGDRVIFGKARAQGEALEFKGPDGKDYMIEDATHIFLVLGGKND